MPEVSQTQPTKIPERFDDGVYLQALEALDHNEAPRRVRWKLWGSIGALVLLLVASSSAYWVMTQKTKQAPSLSLSISPAGSDLLIAWAGGAHHSKSSKLKVRDDGHDEEFDLLPSYEIAGTLVYHPKTSHVHVLWAVDAGGRFYGVETDYQARAVAPDPLLSSQPAPAPATKRPPPKSDSSAAASRAELERMQAHNRRMEALVKALKARQQNGNPQ